ncbi:MAG TPA: prephenate dehydrogenase dimerization domain-containing protein [Thermoanaerobaculia bacterium]|nr:prephenate dehydrogenase dimerization domain-containing protein [Thermoanaerobaculia bacterium]
MPTALIAGLGLIGGSIGIALRGRGWFVSYLDPYVEDPLDAADERVHAIGDADLVILATPVDVALRLMASGRDARQPSGVSPGGVNATAARDVPPLAGGTPARRTTSVCSVMQPLRAIAGRHFTAGHPLAGSERRGIEAARGDLFAGKRWFVDREDDLVAQVIADCGATQELVNAEEHDRAMALTSHLPQVLSTALAALIADEDRRFLGSGAKTFLRLAGSEAGVWGPILDANRDNIRAHFERFVEIARAVIDDDPEEAFRRANRLWEELSAE